jgi:hypothetical protein
MIKKDSRLKKLHGIHNTIYLIDVSKVCGRQFNMYPRRCLNFIKLILIVFSEDHYSYDYSLKAQN